jgi:hypothetical protein
MLSSAGDVWKQRLPSLQQQRWLQAALGWGVSSKAGELTEGRALSHQKPWYLLGYVLKFMSCQFTLERQPENVHTVLTMTMTAKITPYLYSLQTQRCRCTFTSPVECTNSQRKLTTRGGGASMPKIRSFWGHVTVLFPPLFQMAPLELP